MNKKEFTERILEPRIEKIKKTLEEKKDEYASNSSAFHNFNVGARVSGNKNYQEAWDYARKHLVSIIDIIDGVRKPDLLTVNEKFGDLINYLILIEGMMVEEIWNEDE